MKNVYSEFSLIPHFPGSKTFMALISFASKFPGLFLIWFNLTVLLNAI